MTRDEAAKKISEIMSIHAHCQCCSTKRQKLEKIIRAIERLEDFKNK